jgi:nitrous-oxide reductase
MKFNYFKIYVILIMTLACLLSMQSCKPKTAQSAASGDASKSFVAPGKYDEFYNVVSGGFNGQVAVYGIPSGRLFRIIPVFFSITRKWLWI